MSDNDSDRNHIYFCCDNCDHETTFVSTKLRIANERIDYLKEKLKEFYNRFDIYPTIPELNQLRKKGGWGGEQGCT